MKSANKEIFFMLLFLMMNKSENSLNEAGAAGQLIAVELTSSRLPSLLQKWGAGTGYPAGHQTRKRNTRYFPK
jgi:hypothetical protein